MNRFFLAAMFFLIIAFFDRAVGVIFRRALPTVKVGTLGAVNNVLADSSEMLILGSSRALHHYDSRILEEGLSVSCYNGGLGGHGLFYSYALLSERSLRHKPKIVVLDVSPNVLVDAKALDKLAVFLPLIDYSKYFSEIVDLNSGIGAISKYINSVKYNSVLYDLVLSHLINTTPDKGFIPLTGTLNLSLHKPVMARKCSVSPLHQAYLRRIVEICRKNQMTVVIVISPSYEDFDSSGAIKNYIADFATKSSIPLFDFSGHTDFVDRPELFKDQLHLNKRGATIFSGMLTFKLASLTKMSKTSEPLSLTVN